MKNETLTTSSLPVGSITTYAGDLSVPANLQAIKALGWLLCDGTSYAQSDYPALFTAIGNSNGGSGTNFNVPNLAGNFLRGVDSTGSNIDPDAANRTAAAAGGNTGVNVGSAQASATALPRAAWIIGNAGAHTHDCYHLNSDMHEAWNGSTYTMARWNATAQVDSAGDHFHTVGGFDTATLPISVALYFIIKAGEPQTPSGTVPAAAILGFGGPTSQPSAGWLNCDGAAYGVNLYPNLLNTMLYNYGGDGQSVFNVPDLRGYFMRGTSHQTGRDPNAAQRYALNTGGNTGDNIGSTQYPATISPAALAVETAGAHVHNIALVPINDHHAAWGASGPLAYNCMEWTDSATTSSLAGDHSHTLTGGDKETRPANIYANFLIAEDNISPDAPPIGTVMSFGGDITDQGVLGGLYADGWLPCNGSSCRIDSFKALYSVIGTTFGTTPLKFNLPDLRGYFVTGAGTTPLGAIKSASNTGSPVNPIITSTNGAHQHDMYNIPTDTHVIDVVAGVDLAENNPNKTATTSNGAHTHAISGGDLESRPINVNVDYIIRFQ